ncbi:MAG: hypothetical protein ACHREM_09775 [Polyangiales bacterium]
MPWSRRHSVALAVVGAVAAVCAIPGLKAWREEEAEEKEEREMQRDHYWRVQIVVEGQGVVKTFIPAFDCSSDGATQWGECGPKLIAFKELAPPTMEARPSPGWRLDRWESQIREPDGSVHSRKGRVPDGRVYLNGFGYSDTGELETVRAVFVRVPDGG